MTPEDRQLWGIYGLAGQGRTNPSVGPFEFIGGVTSLLRGGAVFAGNLGRAGLREIGDYYAKGNVPKASELIKWAEKQGWIMKQKPDGPRQYYDKNGVRRLEIKQGSSRTPGSEDPHISIRNRDGQRIDIRACHQLSQITAAAR